MKTKFIKKLLTAAMAATIAFTSAVPAYAAEDVLLLQDAVDAEENGDGTEDAAGTASTEESGAVPAENSENVVLSENEEADTTVAPKQSQEAGADETDKSNGADESQKEADTDESGKAAEDTENPAENAEEGTDETAAEAGEEEALQEITSEADNALLGTADSVEITFNYYTIYDENNLDDLTKTILYKSITKTIPLGFEKDSEEAQRNYVYPYVASPSYGKYVFDCWGDKPDTDLEKDYNDSWNDGNQCNWISLDGYWQSPVDPSEFAEAGSGVINVYAQWKLGDGIKVVVDAGEGECKDPNNYLTTLHVGDVLRFDEGYTSEYSFGIYPPEGYYLEGIYLDKDFSQKLTKSTSEHYSGEVYYITEEMLAADGALYLYCKYKKYKISEITVYGFSGHKTITGEFDLDDVIPELTVSTPAGEEFKGFWARSYDGKELIEVIPGTTKFSDIRIYKRQWNHTAEVNIDTRWRDARTYTVNYIIDTKSGAKITKKYTTSDRNTLLNLSKEEGALSDNDSIGDTTGFLGWATKDGKEFGKKQTVGNLMDYMRSNNLTSIDMYAQWDRGAYTVEFKAGAEWDADYSFAGSELTDGRTETVGIGETYILTGKEFVRKGYVLDHWDVKVGDSNKTLKANQTFKDLAADKGTATLTAVWKKQTYTVKLNANGGTMTKGTASFTYDAETVNIKNGKNLSDEITVTKTGYTFEGWYEGTVKYEYYGKDIYKNLNLTAKWSPVTYAIKLDPNGGEVKGETGVYTVDDELAYDKTVNLADYKAVREGYTFVSWKEKDAETTYKATQKVSKLSDKNDEVTLVANWKANSYKIGYDYDGGALPKDAVKNPASYAFGDKIADSKITAPVKAGYTFAGYTVVRKGKEDVALDSIGANWSITGPLTLKANWTPLKYKVVIEAAFGENGTSTMFLPTYAYSETVNFNSVLRDMDSDEEHNIKGLSLDESATNVKYANDKDIKVADLVKAAEAAKAIKAPEAGDGDVAGVITLYGVIDSGEKTWYINYQSLSGTKLSKNITSYKTGKSVTLPKATKKGYTFLGWVLIKDGNPVTEVEDENLVYANVPSGEGTTRVVTGIKDTAKANYTFRSSFLINRYNIKIMPNGKDVKEADAKANAEILKGGDKEYSFLYENNAAMADELNLPTMEAVLSQYQARWSRTGYTLVGFGLKSGAKEEDMISSFDKLTLGKVATIYAIWKPNATTITYQNKYVIGDNTYPMDNTITEDFGGEASQIYGKALALKKVSAAGYTFAGWRQADGDPAEGLTIKSGFVTGIKKDNTKDHTFYAVFTNNTYNIKLNTQGGTLYNPATEKTFKGTQVIAKNKIYVDPVWELGNSTKHYSLPSKKGYIFVGIATDSKGKNLITDANGDSALFDEANNPIGVNARNLGWNIKNKGTVTVYAIWKKVDAAKVTGVSASYLDDTLTAKVSSDVTPSGNVRYEMQYSTSTKFTKKTTVTAISVGSATITANPSAGSNFYVKVRVGVKDSSGNYVFGKWSSAVRASKTAVVTP